MTGKHLSSLDYDKYLESDDISAEYIEWLGPISEHLMECSHCQRVLNRIMQIEYVYEYGGAGFAEAMKHETAIKKIILVEKIKDMCKANGKSKENERMQQLVDRLMSTYVKPVRKLKQQIALTRKDWYNAPVMKQDKDIQLPPWLTKHTEGMKTAQASQHAPKQQRPVEAVFNGQQFAQNMAMSKSVTAATMSSTDKLENNIDENIKIANVSYDKGNIVIGVEVPIYTNKVTVIIHGEMDEVYIADAKLHRMADNLKDKELWLAVVECKALSEYYDIYVDVE